MKVKTKSHFLHLSCSTPLFSLAMGGSLVKQGKSWLLPGATEADLKVSIDFDPKNHCL